MNNTRNLNNNGRQEADNLITNGGWAAPKGQAVRSAHRTFLDLCDAKAQSFGMTREAFFTRYSGMQRQYRELVTGDY
jgi:hypothetical protein